MNLLKRGLALTSALFFLGGVGLVAAGPASAENPTCPPGSYTRAYVDHTDASDGVVYTSAITCFKEDGDVFYYQDTHSEGMAGGMYYYADDGLAHDHDYEHLWDTNSWNSSWEVLNTNETEGTAVHYRACLRNPNAGGLWGCGAYRVNNA